ncbi:hypothetical protein GGR57DRAFT_504190 [Xylariaceae sp. FL1272]|nr:hypothetical protein GGR57DRAFT_504190 [Xylariaceae sp. FL1272]
MESTTLKQIALDAKTAKHRAGATDFATQQNTLQASLLRLCPAHIWYHELYSKSCPRPILVANHHNAQLEKLQEALTMAIADIVPRWFTDGDACFPKRMPLKPEEEDHLRWLDGQVLRGNLRPFPDCMGSWRPDFLIEEHRCADGTMIQENFCITEINARFSFNGSMVVSYGQQALERELTESDSNLMGATEPQTIVSGLFDLFDPKLPLHLLKGVEHGIDIHMFVHEFQRRFGVRPRIVTPSELRLIPDPGSKTRYRLCCLAKSDVGNDDCDSETLEDIYQIGLEVHQQELAATDSEMLRQISLRCFNDIRTILLVHDKRMLGIIKEELPNLVSRHVIGPEQAQILRRGIVDTIVPGSQEMDNLLQTSLNSPDIKNEYILKPIRSGKGEGIVFGEDLPPDDWIASLSRQTSGKVIPGVSCVVQRRIMPRKYDLMLDSAAATRPYNLVGTFHIVNGLFRGLGVWRAGEGRIVAVTNGGWWICSVTARS